MKSSILFLLFTIYYISSFSQIKYSVPDELWAESFGNHRTVLQIDEPAEKVYLNLEWRRHDSNPADKKFIIIEKTTGDTIPIIERITVGQEKCELVLGPVKSPGIYYFYYLPFQVQEGYGFYYGDYLRTENEELRTKLDLRPKNEDLIIPKTNKAEVVRIEARTLFDSFYPMEVIALEEEVEELIADHPEPFLIFPENREYPIRMKDAIPQKWIYSGPSDHFLGAALKNEYYAFQLGVFASTEDITDLKLEFTDFPAAITCFNSGGIDPYGTPFTKVININKGEVQPLWFGLDIPVDIESREYSGTITVSSQSHSQTVRYTIMVLDESINDRGDSEPWRHSRLRWLNSTIGLDLEPVKPYGPVVEVSKNLSKTSMLELERHASGLPAQISVKKDILSDPVFIRIKTGQEEIDFEFAESVHTQQENGEHKWEHKWSSEKLDLILLSSLEFDGYQRYTMSLNIREPLKLDDFSLNIPFLPDIATYMMGMGLPGCETPQSHTGKWLKPQDSYWMGNAEGGLWCEIRGSSYHGPLQNLYKPGHPRPWYNDDKGYFSIEKFYHSTLACVGTGPVEMYPGEKWIFEFALLPTPVKELNPADQFTNRYYHSGGAPDEVQKDLHTGIKILNVHHANQYNPYINYPFIAVDTLQSLIDQAHDMGLKLKIYYTIRELTNHVTEIWALRSLGDEILRGGGGGGYPWLREHFIDDYYPQWYQHFEDGSPDASCLTSTTASRWYNYYIEGLRWLIKNQDIDGLYLDDVSFDRRILKRMRKVMEETKPGCLIDLHSNTGFSIGPAIQYTGYFPYVDKLWFGESFQYNQMPADNWFVEVSGIPFGLMGDMLHGGGNRWLGMLFGMTVRLPWTSEGNTADPRPVWKFWDDFGIAEAEMIGFWDDCPVDVIYSETIDKGNNDVNVTIYKKEKETLIAIGNFGEVTRKVKLNIDWNRLGLIPEHSTLVAPEIEGFQPAKSFEPAEEIVIPAKQGWLIRCRMNR